MIIRFFPLFICLNEVITINHINFDNNGINPINNLSGLSFSPLHNEAYLKKQYKRQASETEGMNEGLASSGNGKTQNEPKSPNITQQIDNSATVSTVQNGEKKNDTSDSGITEIKINNSTEDKNKDINSLSQKQTEIHQENKINEQNKTTTNNLPSNNVTNINATALEVKGSLNNTTTVNETKVNTTAVNATSSVTSDALDINKPGVVKRALIVFGGFALLAAAYFLFYRKRSKKNQDNNTSLNATAQFRYGILQSEDSRDNVDLSRVPLTLETDDDEEENLNLFDLEQKKTSLSYVNLHVNDEEAVFGSRSNDDSDKDNLLLDIEEGPSSTLIDWSNNGNKSIL